MAEKRPLIKASGPPPAIAGGQPADQLAPCTSWPSSSSATAPAKAAPATTRKIAAGKTPMEAMRCLKRRLSDIVYHQMILDALVQAAGPGARSQPGSSAREVLRALFGEMAVQRARGLADFDHVAVRVSHVAADLRLAVDWRRDELRALRLPFLVAGPDVSDPQVQEDRGGVAWLVIDRPDGLVASSAPLTRVQRRRRDVARTSAHSYVA